MDEVDSIGSARTENSGGGGDSEVQRTMLELLNQLDGFEASNKIKVRTSCECQQHAIDGKLLLCHPWQAVVVRVLQPQATGTL